MQENDELFQLYQQRKRLESTLTLILKFHVGNDEQKEKAINELLDELSLVNEEIKRKESERK